MDQSNRYANLDLREEDLVAGGSIATFELTSDSSRAVYLGQNPRPLWFVLALPFCMSLFHSTRRQMTVSWTFVLAIVFLVWVVRALPQPWRGIIDGGVVLGLVWGLAVILALFVRYLAGHEVPPPGDLPLQNLPDEQPATG